MLISVQSLPLWRAAPWKKWILSMLDAAGRALYDNSCFFQGDSTSIELQLVRDADIAQYNDSFLGCTGPTNILSFPLEEGPESLGTLILSVDTLCRESRLYGQDTVQHSRRLLAHGLAHLMGFDHGPQMDEICQLMENAGNTAG